MVQKIMLDGVWKLRRTDGCLETDAAVPGSVLTDLFRSGLIPDPFFRDNEKIAEELSMYDYDYEREFILSSEDFGKNVLDIVFSGIDTLADVWINDVFLFSANNMHRTWRHDIRSAARPGRNSVRVRIHSPSRYITERQQNGRIRLSIDSIRQGCQYIRKAHHMFGWDWGPQMPDAGIWRPVCIESCDDARLGGCRIEQCHRDGTVTLRALVQVEGEPAQGRIVRLTVRDPDGVTVFTGSADAAGECVIPADIREPRLWWANGYGSQDLYTVQTELLDREQVIDRASFRIGLRTLSVSQEPDPWGREFCFVLNGKKIFAMGANYIPEDNLTGRRSPGRTMELLRTCRESHFNSIRVWGGGYYPDDWFYDQCDELGLIVWQDFMFACNIYEFDPEFHENVRQEAVEVIRRVRNHACLGLWCGNNEMETGWHEWGFESLSSADHLRQYREFFENELPSIVLQEDPSRFYWPSSPHSGSDGAAPADERNGDNHYWAVWHGLKPFTDYRNHYFRFLSEFGFQSFPNRKTVESFTLEEDRNVFSYVMEQHQKNHAANGKILFYLSENYLYPKNLSMLIYASQLLQAEAMKYCVEHMRRSRGRCMGSYYWQLNDCWPVASWSGIDYYGRMKALQYYAKRFYAPVLLSGEENGTQVRLHVANESMKAFCGTVCWQLRDNRSAVILEGSSPVEVRPMDGAFIADLDLAAHLPTDAEKFTRYLSFSLVEGPTVLSESTLLFCKAKYFHFIQPEIRADITDNGDHFTITLVSSAYAQSVELDLEQGDGLFSENWFPLHAGERKTVILPKESLDGHFTAGDIREQLIIHSVYGIAND